MRAFHLPASPLRDPDIPPAVWRLVGVFVLGAFMSVLDTTIVNVALHAIGTGLHSGLASVQWITSGYLLALGATIPIAGWASRRFGSRRVYIVALVLFTGGSALCGLSQTLDELIFFRVVQGVGGALIFPVGQASVAKLAGPHNMAKIMSYSGVPIIIAPVIGPTIGGALIDGLSWRWIFWVNLPVGAFAVWAALRHFPHDSDVGAKLAGRLDVVGLGLLSAGLVGLIYGVSEIGILNRVIDPQVLAPFFVGLALCAAFVVHARRVPRPLLDMGLWKDRGYAAASVCVTTAGGALFGAMIVLPLYFQEVRGQVPLDAGLLLIPQGAGALTAMFLGPRVQMRWGGGIGTLIGVALSLIGTIPLIFIGAETPYLLLEPILFIRGVGTSMAIVPAMTSAIMRVRGDQVHDATPQLNVLQRLGGSLGGATLAVVLSRHIAALHSRSPQALAHAFSTTWIWAVTITALSAAPAFILARIERTQRAVVPIESVPQPAEVLA